MSESRTAPVAPSRRAWSKLVPPCRSSETGGMRQSTEVSTRVCYANEADVCSPLPVLARNQGRSPPGSARPPPRAGAFATSPAELRGKCLSHKVPRTSVAAPTRRSDAALSWFLLNDRKGLETDIWRRHRKRAASDLGMARRGWFWALYGTAPPTDVLLAPLQTRPPGGGSGVRT